MWRLFFVLLSFLWVKGVLHTECSWWSQAYSSRHSSESDTQHNVLSKVVHNIIKFDCISAFVVRGRRFLKIVYSWLGPPRRGTTLHGFLRRFCVLFSCLAVVILTILYSWSDSLRWLSSYCLLSLTLFTIEAGVLSPAGSQRRGPLIKARDKNCYKKAPKHVFSTSSFQS